MNAKLLGVLTLAGIIGCAQATPKATMTGTFITGPAAIFPSITETKIEFQDGGRCQITTKTQQETLETTNGTTVGTGSYTAAKIARTMTAYTENGNRITIQGLTGIAQDANTLNFSGVMYHRATSQEVAAFSTGYRCLAASTVP